jgi:hypothetical protein
MQLYDLMNLLAGQSNSRLFDLPASRPAQKLTLPGSSKCGDDSKSITDKYSPGTDTQANDGSGLNKASDGTYYYRREAKLDYRLDMSFDLAAIARVAAKIENGDLTEAESLLAGGFGLHADFQADGSQTVETNITDENQTDSATRSKSRSRAVQGQALARRYGDSERGFALDMFRRDASSVRRSLKSSVRDSHRKTTNKIAVRFQSDTQFSFALAQRFNVQTQQVADTAPESLESYLKSTGGVAENGSADMMATFFDAVDAYLQGSYEDIKSRTGAFLDQAAGELGFSGELVDTAREQLTASIDSFFGRVTDAVAALAQQFGADNSTVDTPAVDSTAKSGSGGIAAPIGYQKAGPTETVSSYLSVA